MQLSQKTTFDWANEYSERNFSVIPLGRDKKPAIRSWKELQERRATTEEIENWFFKTNNNIGIVTGKISGLIAVDADGTNGIHWVKKNLPVTTVANRTNKGFHYIFRYTPGLKNRVRAASEIDIRSDGGYIVVPPSIHQSGHIYHWVFRQDFDEESAWENLEEIPENIKQELNGGPPANTCFRNSQSPHWYCEPVKKGCRNMEMTRRVGRWTSFGLTRIEVLDLALQNNQRYFSPPLLEKEVCKVVDSIAKKHAIQHTITKESLYYEPQ